MPGRAISWSRVRVRMQRTQSSGHMTCADRLESDKGGLHTGQSTNSIPGGVSNIELAGEASHQVESQCMKRDHVCDEGIST